MKIDSNILNEWEGLKDQGDLARISEESNISRNTIQSAFSEGECTEKTFMAIAEYFKAKKERIEAATK